VIAAAVPAGETEVTAEDVEAFTAVATVAEDAAETLDKPDAVAAVTVLIKLSEPLEATDVKKVPADVVRLFITDAVEDALAEVNPEPVVAVSPVIAEVVVLPMLVTKLP
jgi:hypothetical protein